MTEKTAIPATPIVDVTQSWVDVQRRLWDGWLAAMRQVGTGLPDAAAGGSPSQVLERAIDTWEPFVQQTLDAQKAAMQAWVDGLAAAPNVPPQLRAQFQQVQELTRGWTDTQRQLWEAMFTMTRQFAATTAANRHAGTGQQPSAELWQGFARPVLEAQAAWLRQWSGLVAGARPGQPHKN